MDLNWSSHFKRAFKKTILPDPDRKEKFIQVLNDLSDNPFSPHLRTHKLRGELKDCWACYVEYDVRVVFTIVKSVSSNDDEILLLDIGSHDEVY